MNLKPFWKYYGGKWRAAPLYPKPEHDTIIEPFAGAAGYSLRYPSKKVILVEKDPSVVATWTYLLRVSPEEILKLPDIQHDQTVDDLVNICKEAKLLIGWWINTGTSSPRKRPSARMRGGLWPNTFWSHAARHRIASQVEAIRHWTIIQGDYTQAPDIKATWFIDPPYIAAGRYYKQQPDSFSALADWCRSRDGQVMVCENVGATWLPFQPFISIKANEGRHGGKVSHEALWVKPSLNG